MAEFKVTTKGENFTVRETIKANSAFEARNKSEYSNSGYEQSVQSLTNKPSFDKKEA